MRKNIKYLYTFLCLSFLIFPVIVNAKVAKVGCGNNHQGLQGKYKVPAKLPELTAFGIRILEVAVPVILVILGSIDLIKAISSGKEDDMKKAQNTLIKRIVAALIVFFIFVIVKLIVRIVAGTGAEGIIGCVDCFVNNNGSCVK